MPIDETAFDKQFLDISNGTGKRRTPASGLFLVAMEKVCQPPYSIVAAWQEDDDIRYTMRVSDDDGHWESWHAITAAGITPETVMVRAKEAHDWFIEDQVNPLSITWIAPVYEEYLAIGMAEAPQAASVCQELYGRRWQGAMVEIGYWFAKRQLLPYFMYIENVIEENGAFIFVHKEQKKAQ